MIFAVSLMATRPCEDGSVTATQQATAFVAPDESTAAAYAWRSCYEQFTTAAGWDGHNVSVVTIPQEWINVHADPAFRGIL